jgi:hypothetical protein
MTLEFYGLFPLAVKISLCLRKDINPGKMFRSEAEKT